MGKIVVSTNVSPDGVIQDPDGKEGFKHGSWFKQFVGKDFEGWAKHETEETLHAEAILLGSQERRVVCDAVAGSDRAMRGTDEQPAQNT